MRLQESYGHGSNQSRQALPQCWQMPIYDTNQHGNLHNVILLMQNKHTDKDTSQNVQEQVTLVGGRFYRCQK